jgi:hypothetical protein
MTSITTCLNQEVKIYGVSLLACLIAGICFCFACIWFSAMHGMVTGGVGFFFGIWISRMWHMGKIQKFIYWHLPIEFVFSKRLIKSHKRYFIS